MPLAIADRNSDYTLLDARNKKIQFLNHVRAELGLANIRPLHSRAEVVEPESLFDTVVTRAFSRLDAIYRLARPLCVRSGAIVAMKGSYPRKELEALERTGARYEVKSLQIAGLDARRHLVIMENRPPAAK